MAIYFLDSGPVGLVRIGYTAAPDTRLPGHHAGSPVPLSLVAMDPAGDKLTEAEIHWRLRRDRAHSEWFRRSADVQVVVSGAAATGRIPGGWYVPAGRGPWADRAPVLTLREVQAKFGLTRSDLAGIHPERDYGTRAPGYPISLPLIPPLVDLILARGLSCSPRDFFETAPMGEAA